LNFDSRAYYNPKCNRTFIPLAALASSSVVADIVIVVADKVLLEITLLFGLHLPTVMPRINGNEFRKVEILRKDQQGACGLFKTPSRTHTKTSPS
jgi:hypothetical protein